MSSKVSEHRTQLYLPAELHQQLKAYAQRHHISMSEAMRQAVAQMVAPPPLEHDPIQDLIGAARLGVSDASDDESIDRMLYGAPSSKSGGRRARRTSRGTT